MIFGLRPYPSYKASGVLWLGEVPEHWKVLPNRSLFTEVRESGCPEEQLLSVTIRDGVVPQASLLRDSSKKDSSRQDKSAYKVVRTGDIAYNKMRAWQGAVGVSSYQGIVSPAYVVERSREGANPQYFHYLFRTPSFVKEAERWSYGITSDMWSLRPEHFRVIYSCVPPPPEQAAIVRFLEHVDRRISRYIRTKGKLIALLEEQKRAVIHEAVTGQIDVRTGQPYASYKDSRVEGFGEIPEHWRIARLKVVLSRPTLNGLFKKKAEFGTGAPLVNVADVYRDRHQIDAKSLDRVRATPREVRRFQAKSGDIFFVRSSLKLEGTGRSAIVLNCPLDTVFECHLVQARPDQRRADSQYLVVQLNSHATRHYLISRANVVTMATVSQDVISDCPVLLPPLREQSLVVRWLHSQWNRIAQSIDQRSREIALLREYRARLVADVVTGKLDVRKAATCFAASNPSERVDGPDDPSTSDRKTVPGELTGCANRAQA